MKFQYISEYDLTDGETLSLPQICDNFMKATHDHRISAIYIQIYPLGSGWATLDEVRRQILNFRKSGKIVVAYVLSMNMKEYYIATSQVLAMKFLHPHLVQFHWMDSLPRGSNTRYLSIKIFI